MCKKETSRMRNIELAHEDNNALKKLSLRWFLKGCTQKNQTLKPINLNQLPILKHTIKEIPMKSFSKAAVIGSALLTTSSAFALDMPDMTGYYYSVQYALLEMDISNVDGSGNSTSPAVVFELGRTVFPNDVANISVEGVFMLGIGDDKTAFTYNNAGSKYTAGLDLGIGVQAKAHRQFNEDFAGYVNLGLMNVSTNISDETRNNQGNWIGPSVDDSQTAYTYAIGAEYRLGEASAVTFSYNAILVDDIGNSDVDMTSFNLGYKASF